MSDLWCPTCCQWAQNAPTWFLTPRCDDCGTELEEEETIERYEVDYREVDISHKFVDEEFDEHEAVEDGESDEAEAEGEAEGGAEGE
jgi:hypothetical protein